jgi:hypothetical protein
MIGRKTIWKPSCIAERSRNGTLHAGFKTTIHLPPELLVKFLPTEIKATRDRPS